MAVGSQLNKKDLVLCSLLAAFCLFLFRDIVLGGHPLFGADFVQIHMGMKQFFYNEIHGHHSIPFWNPYIFGGIPFWAHFESTIFYPLDILFWVISPEMAYGPTMFMHLVFSAISMYLLARSFRFSPAGCFVAAAVFAFNGFIMAVLYDGQMFRVQSYPWIPLIIYFLHRALTSKSPYWNGAVAGFFWGVQILAGAPQDAFYTFLGALLFLASNGKYTIKELHHGLKKLTIVILLLVTGAGIAAIQIVPAVEFVGHSVRAGLNSYEWVTIGSYPPQAIVTALMPHFFGSYVKGNFWVSGVPWSVPLYNLYVGILPIIMLFFVFYHRSEGRRIIAFALSLAVLAFVLALGSHSPLYRLTYLLPGFDRIRAPSKIIVLWVFALALLAGRGMEDLCKHGRGSLRWRTGLSLGFVTLLAALDALFHFDKSSLLKFFSPFILDAAIPTKMTEAASIMGAEFHRLTLLSILIALFILLWLRGALQYRLMTVFLCALLLTDLWLVNMGAVRHRDEVYRWAVQTKRELNNSLGKDKGPYRVGSYKFGMGANIEMYLGYQSVGGYGPLFLRRYYEYVNQYRFYKRQIPAGWQIFFYGIGENSRLMDLLNVKYEISHATKTYGLRKTYLPRAFVVPNSKIVRKEEVLELLIRPDFDPSDTVLLEKGDFERKIAQHVNGNPKMGSEVHITSYRPDQIVLKTRSARSGYLFLSEAFYPGWKAFVDGESTRILRGDYLFRVIELPEGRHVIRFVFDPLSIKLGIALTLLSLFLLFFVAVHRLGKAYFSKGRLA